MKASQVLTLLTVLIVLSGCTDFLEKGREYTPWEKTPSLDLFFGKNVVVTQIFSPGDKVLSSAQLNPLIFVTNYGEGLADGEVCITGLDSNVFGAASCECARFILEKEEDETFAEEELYFGPYPINIADISSKEALMTVLTRYIYESGARLKICMKSYGCNAKVVEEAKGPIAITYVEEIISEVAKGVADISLVIGVKNNDRGNVIRKQETARGCSGKEESTEPEVEARLVDFPTLGNIKCDTTQMLEDEAVITCEAKNVRLQDSSGNYLFEDYNPETMLVISYGYENAVSKEFEIV